VGVCGRGDWFATVEKWGKLRTAGRRRAVSMKEIIERLTITLQGNSFLGRRTPAGKKKNYQGGKEGLGVQRGVTS